MTRSPSDDALLIMRTAVSASRVISAVERVTFATVAFVAGVYVAGRILLRRDR